jgi:UDPglucose 6-dehydrogenase
MGGSRLGVVGLGKLGLPLAAVLGSAGHSVIGVDQNSSLIEELRGQNFSYVEPELNEYLKNYAGKITFTTDFENLIDAEIVYVIVPTPSDDKGLFINDYLLQAIHKIGEAWKLSRERRILVVVSTVMPGSTRNQLTPCLEKAAGKIIGESLQILYSPEFIAIGSVISDLQNPDLLLIGGGDSVSIQTHLGIIQSVVRSQPTIRTLSLEEAELVKLLINNFITMKITFANHIAELTDLIPGTNAEKIAAAIGNDSRIGSKYLRPGLGFGGPCFPRDTRALVALSNQLGWSSEMSSSVATMNSRQPSVVTSRILRSYDNLKSVGIYGLAYKAGSVLLEESQAVLLAKMLVDQGLGVRTYDPLIEAEEDISLKGLSFSMDVRNLLETDLIVCTQPVTPNDAQVLKNTKLLHIY